MPEEKTVSVKPETDFMSLVKFDQTKKGMVDLAEKSKDLKIEGLADKEGYKAVHEAQMELREIRVKGEKDRLNFSRMLIDTGKKLKGYHDEIFSPVIEEEARLKGMKDEIEAEKQKIKDAEAEKERERIQGMVSRLTESGAVYNPMSPQNNAEYGYGDLKIDMVMISTMADSVFESFIENVVATKKIDDDRSAEEAKLKKEQEAKEQKEREEFEVKQKEQQAKEDELRKKEEALEVEKQKLEDEKNEKVRREAEDKRVKEAEENAKKETEERLAREAKEKADSEAEEKRIEAEKAAKNKKYITWLKKYDLTPDMVRLGREESDYWVEIQGDEYLLFKKVDNITIE